MSLRVLFLNSVCPYPIESGYHLRNIYLLDALAKRSDVTLICPAAPNISPGDMKKLKNSCAELFLLNHANDMPGRMRRVFRKIGKALIRRPDCFMPKSLPEMTRKARELSRRKGFDIVFGSLSTGPAVFAAQGRLHVIDEHNIEEELYRRLWQTESFGVRKIARLVDWWAVAGFERKYLSLADAVTVCSEREKVALQKRMGKPGCLKVIPNGVDTESIQFVDQGRETQTLLMVGGMSYTPNVDGACFLVRDILPLVWKKKPGVRLYLVGSNPAAEVRALAGPQVEVTGTVADVRPFLDRATLAVVPLRSGGGTRLKILEAMAGGVPVISTELGAEGLNLQSGTEVCLTRTAQDMAQAILDLLSNQALARKMATAARRRVEAHFGWNQIGPQFVDWLEHLAILPKNQRITS